MSKYKNDIINTDDINLEEAEKQQKEEFEKVCKEKTDEM